MRLLAIAYPLFRLLLRRTGVWFWLVALFACGFLLQAPLGLPPVVSRLLLLLPFYYSWWSADLLARVLRRPQGLLLLASISGTAGRLFLGFQVALLGLVASGWSLALLGALLADYWSSGGAAWVELPVLYALLFANHLLGALGPWLRELTGRPPAALLWAFLPLLIFLPFGTSLRPVPFLGFLLALPDASLSQALPGVVLFLAGSILIYETWHARLRLGFYARS